MKKCKLFSRPGFIKCVLYSICIGNVVPSGKATLILPPLV